MRYRLLNRASVAAVLLVVFWACLFVATHVPLESAGFGRQFSDKILHFAGYAGLALLLCWAVSSRRRFTSATWLAVMVAVSAYATADELLQIPIAGRTAEVGDWVADVAGAACGSTGFAVLWVVSGAARARSACHDRAVTGSKQSSPPSESGEV
jgi:VanZ family protein